MGTFGKIENRNFGNRMVLAFVGLIDGLVNLFIIPFGYHVSIEFDYLFWDMKRNHSKA